ncbi:50S ribosomal protein L31 [Patescibacteria group bacterium]|nr:50S ribosomal protein L31 [Patescibacteria group bacterium]MBU1563904.1 50S ribosomal protein L31 [Patescibacteria group bacterium]MBU2067989.1 50S ribosomal protein L31 [Patescibacteria group bacterium]
MKKDTHPKYYPKAKTHCACGAEFNVGSVKENAEIEICSQCHPFYTGKEKIIETGQVEKFRTRLSKVQTSKSKKVRSKKKPVVAPSSAKAMAGKKALTGKV